MAENIKWEEEDNRKIKDLKLRVRNLYAKYKSIPKP